MGRGTRRSTNVIIGSDEIRSLLLGETLDDDLTPSWIVEPEHSGNSGPMAASGDDEIVETFGLLRKHDEPLRFRPLALDISKCGLVDFKVIVAGAMLRKVQNKPKYYRAYVGVRKTNYTGAGDAWGFVAGSEYGLTQGLYLTDAPSLVPDVAIVKFNLTMTARLLEGYEAVSDGDPQSGPVKIDREYFDQAFQKLRVD
jgi:hypothetical protein